jgi:hypothetical protein
MNDPYADRMNRLEQAVLSGSGQLAAVVRQAAAFSGAVPTELAQYVHKVSQFAYKVTDEDVAALREAGYSEDQIFELTVSIALGAGLSRLKVGRAALAEGADDATAHS